MDSFKDETNETKPENLPKFYNYSSILEKGSLLSFAGTILLLISFCSPYWLQSWADTRSPFLNLGLWSVCFYRFRHPKVQLDRIFHGCYPVWGENLQIISYWMAPGWMIFIQVFATGALALVLFSQIISVSLLLRSPLQTVIRYERKLLLIASVLNGIPGLMMIIIIIVFPSYCFNRDYLLYPNYNYVSWSFAMAIASIICFLASALLYKQEYDYAVERKEKNLSILYMLNPKLNPNPVFSSEILYVTQADTFL